MNRNHFLPLMLLSSGLCVSGSNLAQSVVVYKHIDASGRVTYSNQPMKGAMVVELSPLTVLPKSQAASAIVVASVKPGATVAGNGLATPDSSTVTSEAKLSAPEQSATAETPAPIDSRQAQNPVTSASPQQPFEAPAVATVSPRAPISEVTRTSQPVSSSTTAAMLAKQRREDVRRRILEGEIDAESQLMAEAQADLQREQAKSVAMRSLRAAILADERALAGKKPLSEDVVATKTVVERHFERIRELQDQVAMHEENLTELKNQLRASPPQHTALKSVQLKPTATAARLDTSKLR